MAGATVAATPAPADGVTAVRWSPCGASLLVAGWSGDLSLHSPAHGALTAAAALPCPALAAAFAPATVYAAGLDGAVYAAALTPAALAPPAALPAPHARAASCLALLPDGALASGGWDAVVRVRDGRAPAGGVVAEVGAGERVYALDAVGEAAIVFVTAARRVRVVDRRRMGGGPFLHDIAPAADAPLRTVAADVRRPVVVVGSVDGRVAVESLDGGATAGFAFKCHRVDGRAYPVNAVAFTATHGSFATGGGDGHVCVWDGVAKKRVYQYPCEATSISSVAFSPDDARLAVAVSYTFEDGERDHAPDAVLVRDVADAEIRTRDAGARAAPGAG